jgi:2-polyprenyl-3-methyl-5-hydroxy-6-metoxy-1,4-benzoquinol methylase
MRRTLCACVLGLLLAGAAATGAQAPLDDETIWCQFIAWFRGAPPATALLDDHAAALQTAGVPRAEARRRIGVIARLLNERSDWIELYFDKVYSREIIGDPKADRFNSAPSPLLIRAIHGVPRGTALDAAMGQGRNAVFLALQGWRVTGFDLSGEAVAAALRNADHAETEFHAVKASFEGFDLGIAKWDLVVMTFAWAPVTDPAFLHRLRCSLRPGGRIVFEHFVETAARPQLTAIRALKPGQLRELFKEFRLDLYEEVDDVGDWGGPGSRLVRMIAVKPSPN